MPKIMEAQIRESRLLDRPPPDRVADLPPDRLALEGEAVLLVLPLLFLQDGYRVPVQRYASRRSILGLISTDISNERKKPKPALLRFDFR